MKACGITDIGKVRRENQDSFIVSDGGDFIISVVCDGMAALGPEMLRVYLR